MTIAKDKFNDFVRELTARVESEVQRADTKKYLDIDAVISLQDINF